MTQEERRQLKADLCSRIPYQPYVSIILPPGLRMARWKREDDLKTRTILDYDVLKYNDVQYIVPYLRPLSSMTDKEIAEAVKYMYNTDKVIYTSNGDDGFGFYAEVENGVRIRFNEIEFKLGYYGPKGIDWLNSRHFDYRGLISMGLALKAPEGLYENALYCSE